MRVIMKNNDDAQNFTENPFQVWEAGLQVFLLYKFLLCSLYLNGIFITLKEEIFINHILTFLPSLFQITILRCDTLLGGAGVKVLKEVH